MSKANILLWLPKSGVKVSVQTANFSPAEWMLQLNGAQGTLYDEEVPFKRVGILILILRTAPS